MKISNYPDTDSLYIDLSKQPSEESREISGGVVPDHGAEGRLVGIDIDNASKKIELNKLTLNKLPANEQASQPNHQNVAGAEVPQAVPF